MLRSIWGTIVHIAVYACFWLGLDPGPALALSAAVFWLDNELSRLGWSVGQALGKIEERPEAAELVGDIGGQLFSLLIVGVGAFLGVGLRQIAY